ncbi:AAA family ATPase [Bremerella sp. JC817]|uniref:AAA family ATPase n=1 Tax=Bremerella sp. JC817 TaxID=3231756 RepID=UPI003457A491
MITGITIENFKGIRDRVKLDFRPITLLFGANSAGKSTILHALHYAREVFERHNLDADQTIAGGDYVDLGGFRNFVNGHNDSATITLGFEVELSDYSNAWFEPLQAVSEALQFDRFSDGFLDNFAYFDSVEVMVDISWSQLRSGAYVSSVAIINDGEEVGRIKTDSDGRRVTLSFNSEHPSFGSLEGWASNDSDFEDVKEVHEDAGQSCVSKCVEFLDVLFENDANGNYFLSDLDDALPIQDRSLTFVRRDASEKDLEELFTDALFARRVAEDLVDGLSRVFLFPLQEIRESITRFHYLGPLRKTPPRNYHPPRYPDPSRWASGLGAWDALQNGTDQFVDAVASWLGDPDNLNAGCRIERRTFLELDYADPIVRALMARRAFDDIDEHVGSQLASAPTSSRVVIVPDKADIELRPHDVGIGISQVVPVIVTALDGSERLLAIEQPELHIHPRLQAEIADLFIEAIHNNKHRFIIETHSEHLILRLLRRIRETEVNKAPADRTLRTDDLAIYYLKQEDGSSRALEIQVDVKGEFIQPWPDDFFEIDFFERFPDAR